MQRTSHNIMTGWKTRKNEIRFQELSYLVNSFCYGQGIHISYEKIQEIFRKN